MGGFKKRSIGIVAAVLASVGGGVLLSGRTEAAGPKSYTVASTPQQLTTTAGPASITLTNNSRNAIAFAALNLTVPTGVTVTSVADPAGAATATLVGNVIQVRNLNVGNVPPANVITISFNAATAVQTQCTALVFRSDVRQSNDFNGTNNKFTLQGADATFSAPCSSSTVTCTASDTKVCTTGTITSTNGNTASVVVNDGDSVTGTLTASLTNGTLTCPEYTVSSDELSFNINVTAGSVVGMTKSVTFSYPVPAGDTRVASEYQVCFRAPYNFPALLPSQLVQDVNNADFSGNTVPDGAQFKGLLLHCGLGQGVPCVQSRAIAGGLVTVTVAVPALDPGMKL